MVQVVSCKTHQKFLLLQTFIKKYPIKPKIRFLPQPLLICCLLTETSTVAAFSLCLWLLTSHCWKVIKNGLK